MHGRRGRRPHKGTELCPSQGERFQGTGLGLSTVYGLVLQNHGTIDVSSERGRGTTFEIYFPAVPRGEEVQESGGLSGSQQGNETILVAEDEPGVRQLVCDALEQLGYTVLAAADGYEALRILEQHSQPVHLLLTDVPTCFTESSQKVLPGMLVKAQENAQRH